MPSPYAREEVSANAHQDTAEWPTWGYAGVAGPSSWGSLHPDFARCTIGQSQSPIDLPTVRSQPLTGVEFNYSTTAVKLVNTGRTIRIDNTGPNSIVLDATTYTLSQIHFHSPSEHTVVGRRFAMEMHLVHEDERGRFAYVGVFLTEGERNGAFDPLLNHLPTHPGQETSTDSSEIDLRALLPTQVPFWRYTGSLTTPPCTEGVRWIVLGVPVTLDELQLAGFRATMHDNNRPAQPLNNRTVRRRER